MRKGKKMSETPVDMEVHVSVIQFDTMLAMLRDLKEIKENVCQYALASGDEHLYNLTNAQLKVNQEIYDVFYEQKKKFWEDKL